MWNDLWEKKFRENTLPERYLSMPGEGNTRRGADAPDKALRGMCQMMRAVPHENVGCGDCGIDKFFDRHLGVP